MKGAKSSIVKTATVYAIAGWLLIQVADISLEVFEAPAWFMRAILMVVLAGFPITLTVTWLIRRTYNKGASPLVALSSIAMATLISLGVYFYAPAGLYPVALIDVEGGTFDQAALGDSNPVIAILPFANMSADESNEYLADGMTEDIITLLAQSPGLDIIVRNSTFKYKGTNPDILDVGTDLNADYVVEGSIRPMGDRIRVTVQVIASESGAHVWAQKFDRELEEFFKVQDEVSLGIAAAVGDAVFRKEYRQLNQSRTRNLSAWAKTSRAIIQFNTLGAPSEALIRELRETIALDPDYALAHAVLARTLAARGLYFGGEPEDLRGANSSARRALSLAPSDPKVLALSALTLLWSGDPEDALPVAAKAVKLSPSYAEGFAYYGDILIHNGFSEEGLAKVSRAISLTPNSLQLAMYLIMKDEAQIQLGDLKAARATLMESGGLTKTPFVYALGAGVELMMNNTEAARLPLGKKIFHYPNFSVRNLSRFHTLITAGEVNSNFQLLYQGLQELEQEMMKET